MTQREVALLMANLASWATNLRAAVNGSAKISNSEGSVIVRGQGLLDCANDMDRMGNQLATLIGDDKAEVYP